MGLDTSHDCWHGPYSQFMEWRIWLNLFIQMDRYPDRWYDHCNGATRENYERAWREGRYTDQSDPLNVLMNHSDCDGEIPANLCEPLADALYDLMVRRMPERGVYDEKRPATERFIAGLRKAAAAGEAVEFH